MSREPAASGTVEVLREILSKELTAKTFYDELVERVKGTEFERFRPQLQAMAEEEAGHAEEVRALLAKYG